MSFSSSLLSTLTPLAVYPHVNSPYPTQYVLSGTVATIVTAFFFMRWLFFTSSVKMPIAIQDEIHSEKKRIAKYVVESRYVLVQGYTKFKDTIFGINTNEGTKIVLPVRYMDELKSSSKVSFMATLEDFAMTRYTSVGGLPPHGMKALIGNLNPMLPSYVPLIHQMVRNEWTKMFPVGADWTPVKVYPPLLRVVGLLSARIFHGENAVNDRWTDAVTGYIGNTIFYAHYLKMWPRALLPLVYRFLPRRADMDKQWAVAEALLASTLDQKKAASDRPLQDPPSVLDFLCSGKNAHRIDDLQGQLAIQVTLAVASIHTSAATTTQTIYDLASQPDSIAELRDEITSALEESGGTLSNASLLKLEKLDSFIKETQRFSSPDLTTFQRKVLQPITLSDGFRIPKGAKIEIATGALNLDSTRYEDPTQYDGLRFWRIRQRSEDERGKHQLVSVTKEDLAWGYGRHACPGRFLANILIKVLLAEFILHLDVSNPAGVPRHKNIELDGQILPDEEAEVLVKASR